MTQSEEKKKALEPCPFCNDQMTSFDKVNPSDFGRSESGYCVCCDCGATGPLRETMYGAVQAWNNRLEIKIAANDTRAALSKSPQGDNRHVWKNEVCINCKVDMWASDSRVCPDAPKPAPQPDTGADEVIYVKVTEDLGDCKIAEVYASAYDLDGVERYIKKPLNLRKIDTGFSGIPYTEDQVCEALGVTATELTARKVGAQTWQPIETAPKDGTKIIVYADDRAYVNGDIKRAGKIITVAHWGDYAGRETWAGWPLNSHYNVTHWMHLPPAPASDDGVK